MFKLSGLIVVVVASVASAVVSGCAAPDGNSAAAPPPPPASAPPAPPPPAPPPPPPPPAPVDPLPRLYKLSFAPASTSLSPATLRAVQELIPAGHAAVKIRLTGFGSVKAPAAAALQARQRAEHVRDVLVKAGIAAAKFEIVANGDVKAARVDAEFYR
jgi:OmpA-OmpF porin, OOP family